MLNMFDTNKTLAQEDVRNKVLQHLHDLSPGLTAFVVLKDKDERGKDMTLDLALLTAEYEVASITVVDNYAERDRRYKHRQAFPRTSEDLKLFFTLLDSRVHS